MKKLFATSLAACLLMVPVVAADPPAKDAPPPAKKVVKLPSKDEIPNYLQDISVTIRAGNAEGSGIVTNIDGDCYVLTCAHVCRHLRVTRTIEDSETGRPKTVIDWEDAEVVKEHVEDGRLVGQTRMQAFVIKYSDADHGEDLAILKVRKKNLFPTRVTFYLDKEKDGKPKLPTLGTELWHMGSFLGQGGSNSLSSGMVSSVGRVYEGNVYDQTNCTAFRGSSGGGVYLKDGRYHSMLVRGAGETFNLVVPMRRIESWAKRVKMDWILNPDVAPVKIDDEWLRKNVIEESHHKGDARASAVKETERFEFMVRTFEREKYTQPLRLTIEVPGVPR
jgi:hypothetical protein